MHLKALIENKKTLWCIHDQAWTIDIPLEQVAVVTNRFDQHQRAESLGLTSHFSDFCFGELSLDHDILLFSLAKEKAINHHLIQAFFQSFPKTCQLIVKGEKNQGIKSILKAVKATGASVGEYKEKIGGKKTTFHIVKNNPKKAFRTDLPDYHTFFSLADTEYLSKPGIFGANKIDKGSELMMQALKAYLDDNPLNENASLLDLGCGYGYLSIEASKLGFSSIDGTDNCAGAVIACKANFKKNNITGNVIADNCAKHIKKTYDWVLCNPPFHQGFEHDKHLIEKFVKSASNHLTDEGLACFVVNQFIGIDKMVEKYFSSSQQLTIDKGFKITLCKKS